MAFMRHNNNGRRHGNRHRHQGGGQNQGGQRRPVNRINQVFESNGPDGRIRGTAQQIVEKYATLARDASASGDKVLMLNYLQHAEHYQRFLNEILEESGAAEREREQWRQQQNQQPDIAPEEAAEGFASEKPAPKAAAKDSATGDENELPGFLQVPITSKEGEAAQRPRPQRPRRAAVSGDSDQ